MKRIIEDYKGYTKAEWLFFGVMAPLGLVSVCIIAECLLG
jgi:hypothetical protein